MQYFNDTCFLCLARNRNTQSVLLRDDDGIVVDEKLQYVLTELVNFKPDVPKKICADCLKDLNYVYKFKQKSLKNIMQLSDLFEKQTAEKNKINSFESSTEEQYDTGHQIEIKQECIDQHSWYDTKTQENAAEEKVSTKQNRNTHDVTNVQCSPLLPEETETENFQEIMIKQESEEIHHEIDIKCDPLLVEELHTEYDSNESLQNTTNLAEEDLYTPPDILEASTLNLLPEKSKEKYEAVYKAFMDWRVRKNVSSLSENVVLAYFGELAEKYKSSSLWAHFSMLKSTLSLNNSVNIEAYLKLRAFLKRKSEGYTCKKAKTFNPHEINKFINDAPNSIYLATKVAFIMGIMGACRANELHSLTTEDIHDLGSATLVTVSKTKSKKVRKFTITGHFYEICKKYASLRPTNTTTTSFFLNYRNGKCTGQKIGINKFGSMGKQVAAFLKLPNPERYTGHSFRRSSATILVDAGRGVTGGWQSSAMVEGYVDEKLLQFPAVFTPQPTNFVINATPGISGTNCTNITYYKLCN